MLVAIIGFCFVLVLLFWHPLLALCYRLLLLLVDDKVILDWYVRMLLICRRIVIITLTLAQCTCWINSILILSYYRLTTVSFFYFTMTKTSVMWTWRIYKHSWIWIESWYIFLFLFSFWTNLIRLDKTLFLTYRKWHFLRWVTIII